MSTYIEKHHDAFVAHLQQLIRFESVFDDSDPAHPFGAENTKALEFMLALGREHGFRTRNLDNKVGYIEYGEGQDYVAVLTHLDVVPPGQGWTYGPFEGRVESGKLIGRGALDDKGPVMMAFYALLALKDEGFVPKHRIRLIMGLNEETGSDCMKHYVASEPQPVAGFTPDADFPVIFAEKGILQMALTKTLQPSLRDGGLHIVSIEGGTAGNMVPDRCRSVLRGVLPIAHIIEAFNGEYGDVMTLDQEGEMIILEAKGKSAHGSQPDHGTNAISLMMKCLDCLDLEIGDGANFVRGYVRRIGFELDGQSLGIARSDEDSGPLTLNVGLIKINEEQAKIDLDIRYPVTTDKDRIFGEVYQEILAFEGWNSEIKRHKAALYHPKDSQLVTQLMSVYQKATGDLEAQPIAIGGGTYARSVENTVAFGILLPYMEDNMHQANEFIALDDTLKITNILREAIQAISR